MTSYDVKFISGFNISLETKYLFMAAFYKDFKFLMNNFIRAYRIWLWIMNLAYNIGYKHYYIVIPYIPALQRLVRQPLSWDQLPGATWTSSSVYVIVHRAGSS